jgi:hypothetical protein
MLEAECSMSSGGTPAIDRSRKEKASPIHRMPKKPAIATPAEEPPASVVRVELGLDRGYSAHSIRATLITTALENGAHLEASWLMPTIAEIARQRGEPALANADGFHLCKCIIRTVEGGARRRK